jgi:hypothetical protein
MGLREPGRGPKAWARARADLLRERSVEVAAVFVRQRLEEIRRERLRGPQLVPRSRRDTICPSKETEAAHRARQLIDCGPDIQAPSRFGVLGWLIRRAVLFLIRPTIATNVPFTGKILRAAEEAQSKGEPPPPAAG